jgi:hypothetical protein
MFPDRIPDPVSFRSDRIPFQLSNHPPSIRPLLLTSRHNSSRVVAMTPAKDPDALRRELVGWYLYDFANSAFFQSAMTVRARSSRLG